MTKIDVFLRVCLSLSFLTAVGCGQSTPDSAAAIGSAAPVTPPSSIVRAESLTERQLKDRFGSAVESTEHEPVLIWEDVAGLPRQIAVFDHVFWEPADTSSFRKLLRESDLVRGKTVLEIGTGSGIVSLCCLQAGATQVTATDINPWAVRNAEYNAAELNFETQLDVRLVPQQKPDAWSVVGIDERFDVIFSNPPWELGKPTRVEDFAFYDPDFKLMTSFLDGLSDHLNPDGRAFLAYGCVQAVEKLKQSASTCNLEYEIHDKRSLSELPEIFLPGMLIEIRRHRSSE